MKYIDRAFVDFSNYLVILHKLAASYRLQQDGSVERTISSAFGRFEDRHGHPPGGSANDKHIDRTSALDLGVNCG